MFGGVIARPQARSLDESTAPAVLGSFGGLDPSLFENFAIAESARSSDDDFSDINVTASRTHVRTTESSWELAPLNVTPRPAS